MQPFLDQALEQFELRKLVAQKTEKIDNEKLPAGSPMYFYCKNCHILTDVLPEDYLFAPHPYCSQCEGLMKLNALAKQ